MVRVINDHRAIYGVEPICAVWPIAPSTYCRYRGQQQDATRRCARARRDDERRVDIQRVYDANFQVYGPRKVWRALQNLTGLSVRSALVCPAPGISARCRSASSRSS